MNEHLLRRWATVAGPTGTKRFQHLFLSPDALEAHQELLGLALGGHYAARRVTASSEYDHARLHDLVANEGFSHHPERGPAPEGGYMASYHAPEGSGVAAVHHISQITPEHIAAHREAAAEHLAQPRSYQGGWHDTATGDVYLDASRHFDHKPEALDFAAHHQQKAIFNLNDFSEHFLHPKLDPLAMKDEGAWHQRYADTGTEPHPGYHSYAHLYPPTDEQRAHWAGKGEHLGSRALGSPVGPWRSERWVSQELARRHGLG